MLADRIGGSINRKVHPVHIQSMPDFDIKVIEVFPV